MRSAEIALLMVPVAIVIAWACGVRGLSNRGTAAALLLIGALGLALYIFGEDRFFTGRYVPARLDGDHILAGHPQTR